jgi:hypothetical protein
MPSNIKVYMLDKPVSVSVIRGICKTQKFSFVQSSSTTYYIMDKTKNRVEVLVNDNEEVFELLYFNTLYDGDNIINALSETLSLRKEQ